jgi:hypothetical protein
VFSRPLPEEVTVTTIPALTDLAITPRGPDLPGAVTACPVRAAHPYLPGSPETHRALARALDWRDPAPCPLWRALPAAGRAFLPPPQVEAAAPGASAAGAGGG